MLKTQLIAASIVGWIVLNCLSVGAYQIYQAYRVWTFNAHQFVRSLDTDQQNELAEALFSNKSEYDEPKTTKKGK